MFPVHFLRKIIAIEITFDPEYVNLRSLINCILCQVYYEKRSGSVFGIDFWAFRNFGPEICVALCVARFYSVDLNQ